MKKPVKMLLMVLVLILLVGGYLAVQRLNEDPAATQSGPALLVADKDADTITAMTWSRSGMTYAFTRTDGVWAHATESDFSANQEILNTIIADLMTVTYTQTYPGVTDPAAYGLDDPMFTAQITWQDGSTITYCMGDATPFGDGRYTTRSTDEGTVYVTPTALSSVYGYTLAQLAQPETLPLVENPSRLTVNDTWAMSLTDGTWTVEESGEVLADTVAEPLVEGLQTLEWTEIFTPLAEEKVLENLHLTDDTATRVTLSGDGDTTLTLLLGLYDASSELCYVRLPGSRIVYTVSYWDVSTLLSLAQ